MDALNGVRWSLRPLEAKGRPIAVFPPKGVGTYKNDNGGGNDGLIEAAKNVGFEDPDFRRRFYLFTPRGPRRKWFWAGWAIY